ncbi:helix-turn-helix transcriptional regulator [Actinoplanes sp. NBC_00393]|uniref:helix-turn-helix domain-containing protein n=1 Tax=Actinoplanes sp. NBC_00393 TaxID=2975953 RepID=UPI002E1A562C
MAPRKAPSIRQRRLAGELKRLRVAAHLKQEHVAERTGLDASSIYRIERAMNKPQRRTVLTLLDLYGVTDPDRRATLLDWLKEPGDGQPLWFHRYEVYLPDVMMLFVKLEAEAESLRVYESMLVPGLLQTEEYARAITRSVSGWPPEEIERRVQVRLHRQDVLHRSAPMRFRAVLDEAAIRRVVGGPAVMRAQLEHLATASREPGITVQVMPFSTGEYPAMIGNFVLMDFATPFDRPVVYLESSAGDAFIENEQDVARYAEFFDAISARALRPAASRTLIEEAARALG